MERSRAAALRAARALLREQGWEAVTHVAVAERGRIGRSTLYRHWPEAADLLREVMTQEIRFAHRTPTGRLRTDLVDELEGYRQRLTDEWSRQVILTVISRAAIDPGYRELRQTLHGEGAGVTVEILAAARARGELPFTDVLTDHDAIAQLAGPLEHEALFAGRPVDRWFVERVVDAFLAAHRLD